ncbi:MAG TPA: hypothetical protein VGP08_17505 [Pyrinomonadaceae bacterium]|nr:hypothetical protein [Pyrinomonadaceae bacterium]
MADKSRGVGEALDRIRGALDDLAGQLKPIALAAHSSPYVGNFNFPFVATRPEEHVLAFHNEEIVRLRVPDAPEPKFDFYLSSDGSLTDLYHIPIPGTHMETNVPLKFSDFGSANVWPANQNSMPYNEPPISTTNVEQHSYSKQMYRFNDKDILYTVGPSLPKITPSGGGAQFWVGSIGVIERGEGKYAGARGISVHDGSAFFPIWPADDREKVALLKIPFPVKVTTYFKFVLP